MHHSFYGLLFLEEGESEWERAFTVFFCFYFCFFVPHLLQWFWNTNIFEQHLSCTCMLNVKEKVLDRHQCIYVVLWLCVVGVSAYRVSLRSPSLRDSGADHEMGSMVQSPLHPHTDTSTPTYTYHCTHVRIPLLKVPGKKHSLCVFLIGVIVRTRVLCLWWRACFGRDRSHACAVFLKPCAMCAVSAGLAHGHAP